MKYRAPIIATMAIRTKTITRERFNLKPLLSLGIPWAVSFPFALIIEPFKILLFSNDYTNLSSSSEDIGFIVVRKPRRLSEEGGRAIRLREVLI